MAIPWREEMELRWQLCHAGLGSAMGFGEVWGAEGLMGKVMGEIW